MQEVETSFHTAGLHKHWSCTMESLIVQLYELFFKLKYFKKPKWAYKISYCINIVKIGNANIILIMNSFNSYFNLIVTYDLKNVLSNSVSKYHDTFSEKINVSIKSRDLLKKRSIWLIDSMILFDAKFIMKFWYIGTLILKLEKAYY